ncbi:hypothetical protein C5167_012081 [Papaver somniferum]|uniref:Uncharacterized protein n=1 Tax=Papaver somniferum TaxID=3469 RepID=A0A4Y7IX50_PAPSO|nr:hypothetical protein C5167_012081 [Papaver somniferum]
MYVIKITIEDELLDHIEDAATPKEAWDALNKLFSRKNDARLQLLESELMNSKQEERKTRRVDLSIRRRKALVQGELKGVSTRETHLMSLMEHKTGRVTIAARVGNLVTVDGCRYDSEEEWDMQASVALAELFEELEIDFDKPGSEETLAAFFDSGGVKYDYDWMDDSACCNHINGVGEMFPDTCEGKGYQMVANDDTSELPIARIGKTTVVPHQFQREKVHQIHADKTRQAIGSTVDVKEDIGDQINGKGNTSINKVFDEAGISWSTHEMVLPDPE